MAEIEWHNLQRDPDDLPGSQTSRLITTMRTNGRRATNVGWLDGKLWRSERDVRIKERVVAWANLPAPFEP